MSGVDSRFGNQAGDANVLAQPADISGLAPVHSGLVDDFLVHLGRKVAQQKASRESWLVRRRQLRIWIRFLVSSGARDTVTTATYRRFLAYLGERYRPSSSAGIADAVRLLYRWADTVGAHVDVAQGVAAPVAAGSLRCAVAPMLTRSQVLQVLNRTPVRTLVDRRNRVILLLLVGAGCETISIHRANVADLDLVTAIWRFQPRGHRSKDAVATLLPDTVDAVRDYLAARDDPDPKSPLVVSHNYQSPGKRLSTLSMRLVMHRLLGGALSDPPDRAATTTTLRRTGLVLAGEGGHLHAVADHASECFHRTWRNLSPVPLTIQAPT